MAYTSAEQTQAGEAIREGIKKGLWPEDISATLETEDTKRGPKIYEHGPDLHPTASVDPHVVS